MGIDKFGRSLDSENRRLPFQIPRTVGYVLTSSGHIDVQGKRICNLNKPTDINDAANKDYVDDLRKEMRIAIQKLDEKVNNLIHKIQKIKNQQQHDSSESTIQKEVSASKLSSSSITPKQTSKKLKNS